MSEKSQLRQAHPAGIGWIQKLLGHASIGTTEIYTHVAIRKVKDGAREHAPASVRVVVQSDLEGKCQIEVADLFDRYTDIGF